MERNGIEKATVIQPPLKGFGMPTVEKTIQIDTKDADKALPLFEVEDEKPTEPVTPIPDEPLERVAQTVSDELDSPQVRTPQQIREDNADNEWNYVRAK